MDPSMPDAGSRPAGDDHLARLPPELVLQITRHLPRASTMVLAQTCVRFNVLLTGALGLDLRCGGRHSLRSTRQRCLYLGLVARADADLWLCDWCLLLHRHSPLDLERDESACGVSPRAVVSFPGIAFHHHHIQLALKYKRLSADRPELQPRLERLMRRHYHEGELGGRLTSNWPVWPAVVKYSFQALPRLVNGWFLVRATWHFSPCNPDGPFPWDVMGPTAVCNHVQVHRCPANNDPDDDEEPIMGVENRITGARIASLNTYDGRVAVGQCHWCSTDYDVAVNPRWGMRLRAWRILGSEALPDGKWAMQCRWDDSTQWLLDLLWRSPRSRRLRKKANVKAMFETAPA